MGEIKMLLFYQMTMQQSLSFIVNHYLWLNYICIHFSTTFLIFKMNFFFNLLKSKSQSKSTLTLVNSEKDFKKESLLVSGDNCILCFWELSHDNEFIFIGIKAFYCKVLEYLQKSFMIGKIIHQCLSVHWATTNLENSDSKC